MSQFLVFQHEFAYSVLALALIVVIIFLEIFFNITFSQMQGCIFSIIREYLFGYSLLDFFGWSRVGLESLGFS